MKLSREQLNNRKFSLALVAAVHKMVSYRMTWALNYSTYTTHFDKALNMTVAEIELCIYQHETNPYHVKRLGVAAVTSENFTAEIGDHLLARYKVTVAGESAPTQLKAELLESHDLITHDFGFPYTQELKEGFAELMLNLEACLPEAVAHTLVSNLKPNWHLIRGLKNMMPNVFNFYDFKALKSQEILKNKNETVKEKLELAELYNVARLAFDVMHLSDKAVVEQVDLAGQVENKNFETLRNPKSYIKDEMELIASNFEKHVIAMGPMGGQFKILDVVKELRKQAQDVSDLQYYGIIPNEGAACTRSTFEREHMSTALYYHDNDKVEFKKRFFI